LFVVAVEAVDKKLVGISEEDLHGAVVWVTANKTNIPLSVYNAVVLLVALRDKLARTRARAANLLALFRRELGVTPKSERGTIPANDNDTKTPLTDEQRLAALKQRRAKLLAEIRRYEDRLGKGRKKRQKKPVGAHRILPQ